MPRLSEHQLFSSSCERYANEVIMRTSCDLSGHLVGAVMRKLHPTAACMFVGVSVLLGMPTTIIVS